MLLSCCRKNAMINLSMANSYRRCQICYLFGFQRNHSTVMALTVLVDKIADALQNGEFVIGVFLDFSKAFDTVNHNILFKKLEYFGIRGIALKWLQSYLYKRTQYVCYNGVNSQMKYITCGVPQGSILGPLLFLLYINDIVNVSEILFPILFADDTNVFLRGKEPIQLAESMNVQLKKICVWLQANKLSLNVKKTHYILFKPKGKEKVKFNFSIKIDNEAIMRVNSTKFLGVMIDSRLNWSCHINYIKNKISKGIGIIHKCKRLLNVKTLLTLYYTFVYPYMHYCIEVWGNTFDIFLNSIVKLQKKAVRIISNSHHLAHTDPLFCKYTILKLKKIYYYTVSLFMYKYINNMLPDVFNDLFIRNSDCHNYQTRQGNTLYVSRFKTLHMSKTLRIVGVKIWNNITKSINVNCSISTFKYHIKKHIMSNDLL